MLRFCCFLLLLAAAWKPGVVEADKKPSPSRRPPPRRQPPSHGPHHTTPPHKSPSIRPPPPSPRKANRPHPPSPRPPLRRPPSPRPPSPRPPSPRPASPRPPRPPAPPPPPAPTVLDLLNRYDDLTLARALFTLPGSQADAWVRSPTEIFTLFVPTDAAFDLYCEVLGLEPYQLFPAFGWAGYSRGSKPGGLTGGGGGGGGQLAALAKYHFLPGAALTTVDLRSRAEATSLPGFYLTIAKKWPEVFVMSSQSRAKIVRRNLEAGQAVVHIVDRVLVPYDLSRPPAVANYSTLGEALKFERLTNLSAAIDNAGLSTLLPRTDLVATVFAPTDRAWASFSAVLLGSALSGSLNQTAVLGLMTQIARNRTVSSFVDRQLIFDHVHIGEGLSVADLSYRTTLAVGGDPLLYDTPTAAKYLVNAVNGTLRLIGLTSAAIVVPDIYVGANRTIVVHVIDGVLVSYRTAQLLGVLSTTNASPPAAGAAAPPSSAVTPSSAFTTLREALLSNPNLTALSAAVSATSLASLAADPNTTLTVFAPSNALCLRTMRPWRAVLEL